MMDKDAVEIIDGLLTKIIVEDVVRTGKELDVCQKQFIRRGDGFTLDALNFLKAQCAKNKKLKITLANSEWIDMLGE